jgi:hypothetical protein
MGRLWRWLWSRRDDGSKPNATCPTCGRPVIVAPNEVGAPYGPEAITRPPEELIAACAVDGRPPFNEATVRFAAKAGPTKGN